MTLTTEDKKYAGKVLIEPLCQASFDGKEAVVAHLLNSGAHKNGLGKNGETPLMRAVTRGHLSMVMTLLNADADVNVYSSRNKYTALHLACKKYHEVVVALLRAGAGVDARRGGRGDARTSLILAAEAGNKAIVLTLLAAGADHTIRDNSPSIGTALSTAACKGNIRIAKILLDQGADVNENKSGYSALNAIYIGGDEDEDPCAMTTFLIKAGADVNMTLEEENANHTFFRGLGGMTPLLGASEKLHCTSMLTLLQHGAKVNAACGTGSNSLHMACMALGGSNAQAVQKAVSLLLRWGADETAMDDRGDTPADDLQRYAGAGTIRSLLARAPADRAWRRRGWLAMLRPRPSKQEEAAHDGETRPTKRPLPTASEEERNWVARVHKLLGKLEEGEGGDGMAIVRKLLGVQEEGVFRTVVSYL